MKNYKFLSLKTIMIIIIFEGLLSWPQNKPLELKKVIKSLLSLCKKVLKKKKILY
jgi:hypothetical protein